MGSGAPPDFWPRHACPLRPNLAPPLPHRLKAPGTDPSRDYTTMLSLPQAQLALAPSTSLTCSTSRAEFMPTRSTQRWQPYSVGFPQTLCLLRPGGSRARGFAGSETRMASRAPSKMGEFLRSAYAKRLVNVAQVHLRSKTLQMHQWGVHLPGACEALCHWRGTIEPLVLNGTLEPLADADLDLVNMFGNAEWPAIRAALRTHFPEASAWTEWQHQADSVTTLPSGRVFPTDRGAEQGDFLGTIQSALVLGEAREFAHAGLPLHFVDDGQCFVRPMLFDRWLRALDSALASCGATRGRITLGNAKSSARLLCPPERAHEFSGWDTAHVRDTVVVLGPDAGATALGSAFGTREQINARAWVSVRACGELRTAINGVDHAPTELVLTRQCADVSKLMYHMRINGDILDHDLLATFDGQLRASVSTSLCGDLPDHSWWQATTGVMAGGLGLRTAVTVALPAFVASRHLISPTCGHHGGSPLCSHRSLPRDDHGGVRHPH